MHPVQDPLKMFVSQVPVLVAATGYKGTYKAVVEKHVSLSCGCLMYKVEPLMETELRDEMK